MPGRMRLAANTAQAEPTVINPANKGKRSGVGGTGTVVVRIRLHPPARLPTPRAIAAPSPGGAGELDTPATRTTDSNVAATTARTAMSGAARPRPHGWAGPDAGSDTSDTSDTLDPAPGDAGPDASNPNAGDPNAGDPDPAPSEPPGGLNTWRPVTPATPPSPTARIRGTTMSPQVNTRWNAPPAAATVSPAGTAGM